MFFRTKNANTEISLILEDFVRSSPYPFAFFKKIINLAQKDKRFLQFIYLFKLIGFYI